MTAGMTALESKVSGDDVVLQVGIPESPILIGQTGGDPSPEDFQPQELRDKNLSPKPEVMAVRAA